MKKQLWQLGLALVILMIVVGGFYAFRLVSAKVEETENALLSASTGGDFSLFTKESTEIIAAISVKNSSGSYRFVASPTGTHGIVLEGYEGLPDNHSAYAVVADIFSLTCKQALENDKTTYAQYGVDENGDKATIVLESGEEITLYLGELNPSKTLHYIRLGDTVYLTDDQLVSVLKEPATFFLSTNVAPYSSDPSQITLGNTTYTDADGASFTVGPTELDNTTVFSSGYSILSPIVREIQYDKVSGLTSSAKTLQGEVVLVHPTEEEKTNYGFSPFQRQMLVEYTEASSDSSGEEVAGSYTILLGKMDTVKGLAYVMRDGVDILYQVSLDTVPWQAYTVENLMSMLLFTSNILEVNSLNLTTSTGISHEFTLTGEDKDTLQGSGTNGETVDHDSLIWFYQLLVSAEGTELVEPITGKMPELTLKVEYKDGRTPLEIQFFASNTYEMIAHVNDPGIKQDFVVKKAYVEKVLSCADTLDSGGEITSILW